MKTPIQSVVRIMGCITACVLVALLVTSGTEIGFGNLWVPSTYGLHSQRFEHGWPWVFADRWELTPTNRFNVFSGKHQYFSLGALLWDMCILLTVVGVAVAFTLARWSQPIRYSLRSLLLLILLASLPFAYIERKAAHCRADAEAESQLTKWGCNCGYKQYVGPLWLARLTGGMPERLYGLSDVSFDDRRQVAANSAELARLLRSLHNLDTIFAGCGKTIPLDANLEQNLRNLTPELPPCNQ